MKKNIIRSGRTIKENRKIQIPVSGLKIGMHVCELDRPWLDTPFILQGFNIDSLEQINIIAEHCEFVYIESTKDIWLEAQERVIADNPTSDYHTHINHNSTQHEYHQAASTHKNTRQFIRSFMDDVSLGQGINVQEIKKNVSECVTSILRNPDVMMWLSKIRAKDECTSEHSLNAGLLAITFGRHLGASEEDLNTLGFAGMVHDIGKMQIPKEILNKQGKLREEEYALMKNHAKYGRDILLAHNNVHHSAVDVSYGHHEALDGSGYPRNIKASGITEFTRIVTICDVYDTITNDQHYSDGQSSLNALKILYQHKGTKFDNKLVTEFISCIGLYPPGSLVELVNGQVGIVISTNYRNRHLPKVLLLRDEHKIAQAEKVINLEHIAKSGDQRFLIKTVVPNGSYDIRIENYILKGLTIE